MQRRHLIQSAAALAACSISQLSQAQTNASIFPNKPIKLVIAFPAGARPMSPCGCWPTTRLKRWAKR